MVPSKISDRGGRLPFDVVFRFKVLILQDYHGLSDEKVEFEIVDRTSFQRFLDVQIEDASPTAPLHCMELQGTAWWRGSEALFDFIHQLLAERGVPGTKRRHIDSAFTDAPRQRHTRDENRRLKEGGGAPEEWSEAKKRQKDVAARGTKNTRGTHYGDKNHVSTEEESKRIDRHETTQAKDHDSKVFTEMVGEMIAYFTGERPDGT